MVRKGEPVAASKSKSGGASSAKSSSKSASSSGKVATSNLSASDLLLASLEKKSDNKSKAPKSGGKAPSSSYTQDLDLPPSESDEEDPQAEPLPQAKSSRAAAAAAAVAALNLSHTSDKEQKKRDKKEQLLAVAAEAARQEALKDDHNAFSVVIGTKAAALQDDDEDSAAAAADANIRDISIENFSVSARGKELLKNASLKISYSKRYGLVGPNGKGKSTLLKLLSWRQIPVPKNIDILLVEQEIVGDSTPAIQAVVAADQELVSLRKEAESLEKKAQEEDGDDDEPEDVQEQLTAVYEKLRAINADAAESRASKILAGLGFNKDMQGRPTKSFSGGWRMRISLARALFLQPTLLLLDEPTNHLDLRAVLWLEEYLMRWKKTLVVVSHDRDFLNSVCTDIIHLHDEQLHIYRGNFSAFEQAYEQKRTANNKKFETFEKQEKAAKRSGNKAALDKVTRQAAVKEAKSRGKSKAGASAVDEGPVVADKPRRWRDYTVEFHFPEPTELTPPLLQLLEVEFSYPGRTDFSLKNIDVGIDMGTRVAIVGPNGAGKSTLLNLLAGDIKPSVGEARKSQKLRIGRYSQHFVDLLTMDETPVQYLLRLHPEQEGPSKQEAVRAKLGKFGLPSNNHLTPIVKLSGGQKARVVFTSISMSRPHILLLDEPTNHLDMQSIDALADALEEFQGGVVLVSHDSRLISRVCEDEEKSQIWVVEDGTVRFYPGTFEEYKTELIREIVAEVDE